MVTCAKGGIFKPLEHMNYHVTTTLPLSRSHVHALRDSNWKEAMLDEYNALITNETWVLVPRPTNVNVVRSMWLFKPKFNADGSLSRYKARLVANRRSQQQGIDCDETFSLVVKPATIRIVLILARSTSGLFFSQSKFAEEFLSELICKIVTRAGPLLIQSPSLVRMVTLSATQPYIIALLLHVSSTTSLTAYTNVDWAACPITRWSTSGYCVFLGDNRLSWSAKRQVTLSRSSAEAEHRGVANVVAETVGSVICYVSFARLYSLLP
uniref:Ribonuclease H-like domain-containing protein n=1 Tax=Tanacetum cinerariifolium TaxID=118510 RepID=A0A6L2JDM5_TANCI|nr:ribonuclease H-like domain-containing protein [Tanacetum cinerariifolium]